MYSGGDLVHTTTVTIGLNYGMISSRNPGAQMVQLVSSTGTVLMTATGGECVYESGECWRNIYNMNVEVLAFSAGDTAATCTTNANAVSVQVADLTAAAKAADFDLTAYDTNLADLATRLVLWNGCSSSDRTIIYRGWVESWKIMNVVYDEAKAGINFNEGAAIQYLAPPALNGDYQTKYQSELHDSCTLYIAHTDIAVDILLHLP